MILVLKVPYVLQEIYIILQYIFYSQSNYITINLKPPVITSLYLLVQTEN